jgi:hypothetical protein
MTSKTSLSIAILGRGRGGAEDRFHVVNELLVNKFNGSSTSSTAVQQVQRQFNKFNEQKYQRTEISTVKLHGFAVKLRVV